MKLRPSTQGFLIGMFLGGFLASLATGILLTYAASLQNQPPLPGWNFPSEWADQKPNRDMEASRIRLKLMLMKRDYESWLLAKGIEPTDERVNEAMSKTPGIESRLDPYQ